MRGKIFIVLFLVFSFLFKAVNAVKADTNFQVDLNAEYKILDDGKTTITNTVSIKNLKSDYFPKKYVLNLKGVDPQNIKAYESGSLLTTSLQENGSEKIITINFDSQSVGKGNTKTFIVSYEDTTLAKKSGEIWEIVLPKVTDNQNYNSYKVALSVPTSLGDEAYISPEPISVTNLNERVIYKYDDYLNLKSGVTAGFGIFQVFSFSLTYHLENQDSKGGVETIAIPPDTSTQKMFYESLKPLPNTVERDVDGNWLASYTLAPKEKITVLAEGYVQIFSTPNNLSALNILPNSNDLASTTYWQADDPKIKAIVKDLNSPSDIYNYVVNTLKYNYERVTGDYLRYGALYTLENPENALCMEFTDLFIALARAKGIPAREINGYAYSMNSEVEPLSLVSDVLHAWPEYWDSESGVWIPIDPTWGATTGGSDFFNKFDLRHFAFVIHGANPVLPYSAGTYKNSSEPTKDVQVSFGKLPERRSANVKFETVSSQLIPFFIDKTTIAIENSGPNALYNFPIRITSGQFEKSEVVDVFLPFTRKASTFNISYGLFSLSAPEFINIEVGNLRENIAVNKNQAVVGQLVGFSILVILIIGYLYSRSHREMFEGRLFAKILSRARKLFQKNNF